MKQLIILLAILMPSFSYGQDSDLGNWLIYIGNKKLNEKWNIHNEVQYRNYNAIGDLEQLLLRTGIGYNVTDNANILLGYGYILSQNYEPGTDEKMDVNEHRIFQQFITKQKVGKLGLQHRYRFEQRFIEDSDYRMRFRYFLGASLPLTTNETNTKTWYLSAYNEIFLNTEEGNYFDRNRLYGGLGFRLNKQMRFELGYMNQFFNQGGRDQANLFMFFSF